MIKVAIAALDANGLEAQVSPHFGRCPYFTLVEVEDTTVNTVEVVPNPYYPNHEPGQVPGFIDTLGANVMLSGGMGGRAVAFFRQYGIEATTGAAGTVRQALEGYLQGTLSGATACSDSAGHGH